MNRIAVYILMGSLIFANVSGELFSQPCFFVYAAPEFNSFSGDLNLESGIGGNLGIGFPYSRNLELFAHFSLPFSYPVDNPGGQVFSTENYYEVYDDLSYYSIAAGFALVGILHERQKIAPQLNFKFGKSWLSGSRRDGFSGLNTALGGGIRFKYNENWNFGLEYSYSIIFLDRLKIHGDNKKIANSVEEGVSTFALTIAYTFIFYRKDELALRKY